jgi:hypothetical protein
MIEREIFYALVREIFDPLFVVGQGFEFARIGYARQLDTKLRQSVGFDLNRETGETFRVSLGLNSPLVSNDLPADESGAYFIQYLTKAGIADFPRNWPCHNEPTAVRSLLKVRDMVEDRILPWLERHQTLSDFAELLGVQYRRLKEELQAAEVRPPSRRRSRAQ